MSPTTHQTVKLRRGRHGSPEQGACVMELASMLAGEPFGDHPRSVCPVIGSCLRAYNDWINDDRRQDLYAYAAKVVGTRAPREIERARAERVTAWAAEVAGRRRRRSLIRGLNGMMRWPQPDDLGTRVIQAVARRGQSTHENVLELIDELIAMGAPEPVLGGARDTDSVPRSLDDAAATSPDEPSARSVISAGID